jgi:hypothetical protein
VLDVAFGHVLLRQLELAGFEDLAPEVVDPALVPRERRIGALQKDGVVGRRCHRHLREGGADEHRAQSGGDDRISHAHDLDPSR